MQITFSQYPAPEYAWVDGQEFPDVLIMSMSTLCLLEGVLLPGTRKCTTVCDVAEVVELGGSEEADEPAG